MAAVPELPAGWSANKQLARGGPAARCGGPRRGRLTRPAVWRMTPPRCGPPEGLVGSLPLVAAGQDVAFILPLGRGLLSLREAAPVIVCQKCSTSVLAALLGRQPGGQSFGPGTSGIINGRIGRPFGVTRHPRAASVSVEPALLPPARADQRRLMATSRPEMCYDCADSICADGQAVDFAWPSAQNTERGLGPDDAGGIANGRSGVTQPDGMAADQPHAFLLFMKLAWPDVLRT